jgi:hypothetical protein
MNPRVPAFAAVCLGLFCTSAIRAADNLPALRSRMGFIIDIRRDNMLEHLMYKAMFEMWKNRPDFVRQNLERQNFIVPLVGDFGGPRTIGQDLKNRGATTTAFYVSNVEYSIQTPASVWTSWCKNVADLPVDYYSALSMEN